MSVKVKKKHNKRICCNSDCGWIGKEKYTVHPKHWESDRLCPVCHEVTEVYDSKERILDIVNDNMVITK